MSPETGIHLALASGKDIPAHQIPHDPESRKAFKALFDQGLIERTGYGRYRKSVHVPEQELAAWLVAQMLPITAQSPHQLARAYAREHGGAFIKAQISKTLATLAMRDKILRAKRGEWYYAAPLPVIDIFAD